MDLDSNDHCRRNSETYEDFEVSHIEVSDYLAHNFADNNENSLPTGKSEKDHCKVQFMKLMKNWMT